MALQARARFKAPVSEQAGKLMYSLPKLLQVPYWACFGMVGNELMTTYTLKTHTEKMLSSS
jgi:hypothetical protein